MPAHDRHPDTAAVHAGRLVVPSNVASSPPLFQASSYEFSDLDDVEAIYGGARSGKIYGRYGGPNGEQFEAAIAELEGAEAAVGAAAGMSAIDAALATNLGPGDAIVATREAYGGTYALLEHDYRARGIAVRYVDQHDHAAVAAALAAAPAARVLYVEALTNPLVRVADLATLARSPTRREHVSSSMRRSRHPRSCGRSRSGQISCCIASGSISAATATSARA